ncbi:MAG: hypothetical protein NXI24_25145 [bacterium]|nr:hypothetical protein [bacterium]
MKEQQFYERMRDASAADFDGHTRFDLMSPEERLAWLSSAVRFFYDHARTLPPRLRPPDEAELKVWRDS